MKQRVLIARSLISHPDLLFLDEPTGAMDPITEKSIFDLIARIGKTRNLSLVVVSHETGFVQTHATHAAFVDRDTNVAIQGDVRSVVASPEVRRRYGLILEEGGA